MKDPVNTRTSMKTELASNSLGKGFGAVESTMRSANLDMSQ